IPNGLLTWIWFNALSVQANQFSCWSNTSYFKGDAIADILVFACFALFSEYFLAIASNSIAIEKQMG
ncbi:MAG: hypothetical protein ABI417_02945, partial [Coleofasciculaceae cyanobacterium]